MDAIRTPLVQANAHRQGSVFLASRDTTGKNCTIFLSVPLQPPPPSLSTLPDTPPFTSAITLLLLPFVGLALFLLRRNFQRGGVSRNLAAGLARRMAERGGGGVGGVGGDFGVQGTSTGGSLSSLLAAMLGSGLRGMELVAQMRRCVLWLVSLSRPRRMYGCMYITAVCTLDE